MFIGFWMKTAIEKVLPSKRKNYFLLSGRGALFLALSLLEGAKLNGTNRGTNFIDKKGEVLIPAYSPQGVISPLKKIGIGYRFYDINPDFSLKFDELRRKITDRTIAILIIHNFGFPQDIKTAKELCEKNTLWLIEDCAQGFLSRYEDGKLLGDYGDLSIFSLTKTLKIPDGAVLSVLPSISNSNSINGINFDINPNLMSRLYQTLRNKAIQSESHFGKSLFYKVSYHLLNSFLVSPYPMSDYAISKLENIDFESIIKKRRENFKIYLDFIDDFGISGDNGVFIPFPKLKKGVCPFGFPLLVERRDKIFKRLKEGGIYSLKSKGWNFISEEEANEFPSSWKIINQIIVLPASQETNQETIKKACKIIRDCLHRKL